MNLIFIPIAAEAQRRALEGAITERGTGRPAAHQRVRRQAPWHFLNFLPEPHQHGSLRPIASFSSTRRCWTAAGTAPGSSASTP